MSPHPNTIVFPVLASNSTPAIVPPAPAPLPHPVPAAQLPPLACHTPSTMSVDVGTVASSSNPTLEMEHNRPSVLKSQSQSQPQGTLARTTAPPRTRVRPASGSLASQTPFTTASSAAPATALATTTTTPGVPMQQGTAASSIKFNTAVVIESTSERTGAVRPRQTDVTGPTVSSAAKTVRVSADVLRPEPTTGANNLRRVSPSRSHSAPTTELRAILDAVGFGHVRTGGSPQPLRPLLPVGHTDAVPAAPAFATTGSSVTWAPHLVATATTPAGLGTAVPSLNQAGGRGVSASCDGVPTAMDEGTPTWVDMKAFARTVAANDRQGPPLPAVVARAVQELVGYRTKLGLELADPLTVTVPDATAERFYQRQLLSHQRAVLRTAQRRATLDLEARRRASMSPRNEGTKKVGPWGPKPKIVSAPKCPPQEATPRLKYLYEREVERIRQKDAQAAAEAAKREAAALAECTFVPVLVASHSTTVPVNHAPAVPMPPAPPARRNPAAPLRTELHGVLSAVASDDEQDQEEDDQYPWSPTPSHDAPWDRRLSHPPLQLQDLPTVSTPTRSSGHRSQVSTPTAVTLASAGSTPTTVHLSPNPNASSLSLLSSSPARVSVQEKVGARPSAHYLSASTQALLKQTSEPIVRSSKSQMYAL